MKCQRCGGINIKAATSCEFCGAELIPLKARKHSLKGLRRTVSSKRHASRRTKIIASSFLVIIAMIIVAGASMSYDSHSSSSSSVPTNVPDANSSNDTSSQPTPGTIANASPSIEQTVMNESNHTAVQSTMNSGLNNTSAAQSNQTNPSIDSTANSKTSKNHAPHKHP